jgi:peptide/nickel transport system permease protein
MSYVPGEELVEDSGAPSAAQLSQWLKQAEVHFTEGRQARAMRLVTQVLAWDETNVQAWALRARLSRGPREAEFMWRRVLALAPNHAEARAFLGLSKEPISTALPPRQAPRRDTLIGTAVFIAKRLVFGAFVLVCIIFLSYLGFGMALGHGFSASLGRAASHTVDYVGRLFAGELGLSLAGSVTYAPVTVAEVVPNVLAKSLVLLLAATVFATVVGISLGIWAANRRRSDLSLTTILASIVGVSVPSFFAALLLQLAVIKLTQLLGRPLLPVGGFGYDLHILLPALVLAARPIAQITRVTFVSVSEVLDQDFVRTAHCKGLSPRVVMNRHVLRNAAIPILTTVGLSLRWSLSSLLVVEFFFGWPGIGFTLLKATSRQDENLAVALLLCLGALFILVNLLLDVSYRFIDPRLRESMAQLLRRERWSLLETFRSMLFAVQDLMRWIMHLDKPLKRWLERWTSASGGDREPASPSPFRAVLQRRGEQVDIVPQTYQAERRRAWLRGTVRNLAFVVGGVLVVGLLVIFFFGPKLAPHSPYTTLGLDYVDGVLKVPPFAPDETYPLGTDVMGRDVLSLLLAGAQQTLLLTMLVVAARMALGILLGVLAGWASGSWLDRVLLGLAEVLAAFPMLLLAMMFILALGIRQGFRPFVIALCLVGWGEVMQYVRAEVMAIRPKLFIESAIAVGLRTPRIIQSHVLPILLAALISIAALEMGAVLMLLGELGFIGIFIGGGAFAELEIWGAPYHYSDVPEWGALLSNVRRYARSYPWVAIYPSLTFFIAILGFNLFGEGVRRMVNTVGLGLSRVVNRYTLALAVLLIVGIGWVRANTGAIAVYRLQAGEFDGQRALANLQALTDPALEGQALGTPGLDATAETIAQQFKALGLQAAGQELTYFQSRNRAFEVLDAVPALEIEDGGSPLVYHQDYVEYPGRYRNLGQVRETVRFLAMGELVPRGQWDTYYPAMEDLNLSGEILMLASEEDVVYLSGLPFSGLLIVAQDPLDVGRRYTLSPTDPRWHVFGVGREEGLDRPMMWISEATADRLLEGTGHTLAGLSRQIEALGMNEVLDLPTGTTVLMDVQGTVYDKVPVRHVIGHMPGVLDTDMGGPAAETILVLAQYDAPPPSPDGVSYPAANDNASGVAVMLETIRTMQESGYQPYRTLLFIAYSAEGLEGGEPAYPPEIERFLEAKYGFGSNLDIEAVVDLRGLGAGEGDGLLLSAGGSLRLANLFEESARRMGVKSRRGGESVDMSIVFDDPEYWESGSEAPYIGLSWEGWEATSRLPADTPESISEDKLEQAGRTLALALMIMGRETNY